MEQLIIPDTSLANYLPNDKRVVDMRAKYPVPSQVDWIICQPEACAIGKKAPPGTDGIPANAEKPH